MYAGRGDAINEVVRDSKFKEHLKRLNEDREFRIAKNKKCPAVGPAKAKENNCNLSIAESAADVKGGELK